MRVRNEKRLDLEMLPEDVRKELLDFYEYLLNKYGRSKKEKATLKKKKLQFFKSMKEHSFVLPENYRFNRGEIHER